jgi:hypothetical protein
LILVNRAGVVIEVHWNLSRPGDYFHFDLAEFFENARIVESDGQLVRVPSETDQALHASCQALRSGFRDLHRLLDAAFLLKHNVGHDPRLSHAAKRQGMATGLWLLVRLQQRLTGVDVPDQLEQSLRPAPFVQRCLESLDLRERAIAGEHPHRRSLKRLLLWLSAPSWAAAMNEIRRYVIPGVAELLDDGHDPLLLPGLASRAWLTLHRLNALIRLVAYQAWRLLRHRSRSAFD